LLPALPAVHDSTVRPEFPAPTRTQVLLIVAALLCYAVGYPVALKAHSSIGWIFVSLGGLFLISLAMVTIARLHMGPAAPGEEDPAAERTGQT
jgi:hypothetical protein